jgi:hypothetical protein
MSHDHRLDLAIDQLSRLADEISCSTCTTRDDEGSATQSWSDDVAYNESQPDFTGVPWSAVTTPSTYASDSSSSSQLSHPATANNRETSGSVQRFTNEVEFLNPSDVYSLNDRDAEHWSGNTLELAWQAMSQSLFTSWEHEFLINHESGQLDNLAMWSNLSSFDIRQLTHMSSSTGYAAQAPAEQHPEFSCVGMQSGQSYPESLDMFRGLMAPDPAQQSGSVEYFESFDSVRLLAGDASSLIQMPSTASESPGLKLDMPAHSTESEAVRCKSCTAVFRGVYARGNYRRHRRQKHTIHRLEYVCEDSSCSKRFGRGDARLKHYRRRHPDIVNRVTGDNWNSGRYLDNITDETRGEKYVPPSSSTPLQLADGGSGDVSMDTTSSTPPTVARDISNEGVSTDGGSIRCDVCLEECSRAAELRRHKDMFHNQNPPQYFCEVPGCNRTSRPFLRKDKLLDHTRRVHTQPTASRAFEHLVEASQATYRCDFQDCEREFDQRADLLRHQRTHTDKSERPHKCEQCGQSFLYPKDLKRHQATHLDTETDEKPSFHCQVASCEHGPGRQGFSRKDGMIRHMRRFHPELTAGKEET